ncbi:hypothetical protein JOQ06_012213 [Pogonophryne albipinna]|uniref:Uncharacterized protein n=1 Tax=Pogonophryne albipinna TaxID=1090488 RepID=A0AAD6BGC0_9TELE|nr:hypothetical protein JOQ06_012213 [Pogonophryne albipinna]
MPLFRAPGKHGGVKAGPRRKRNKEWMGSCRKTDEDGSVLSLTRLCLLSLAENMKEVWVKDYADNYLDHFSFRYIMGPFNLLPGELVEDLTLLLGSRRQMSRAALHLLLVPQLRGLSLEKCPGLVNSALCAHIAARCQALWSLDLSAAQQLSSKVLSETLGCLPVLRSLSLAGTPCDRCVIRTIAQRCRFLRHLDISRCHLLSPAALLPLGGGASFSPYSCPSSLLALDIDFGEQEGDPVAAAAYLFLSLPYLERVAMEGLAQACCLIQEKQFGQTEEFTSREGVPQLLSRACPDLCSISVNIDDGEDTRGRSQGSLLAAGLQACSGQLQSLTVHYPGPLVELLPALQVAGSSLVSLTLEGVQTSPHTPLLEVIKACPRLRDLHISAEPPSTPQEAEDEEENQREERDLPQLPHLCSLTLNFSYEHSQMKPVMSWMSLKKLLKCLLAGSPLLEKISLVSLPCPLNCVLQDVLSVLDLDLNLFAEATDSPPMPLARLQRIDMLRTDVEMITVKSIMQRSKRLKNVDVSYCWQISNLEVVDCKMSSKVKVVWL